MKRRKFVEVTGAAALTSACRPRARTQSPTEAAEVFAHGVASGDPLADRVILWTRVSVTTDARAEVTWVVARDPALHDVVRRGSVVTDAERDHTVKVDVDGLEPGRTYHYGFEYAGQRAGGRTKTLPVGAVTHVRLASCSCSNYPAGYFNVYAAMAARDDLDAVLHLGDYIYEYADGVYGDSSVLGRVPEPPGECTSLADYRARYASYRRDPDLQALHRRHPVIAVWDDHELANDTWDGGAENHGEGEGSFTERRAAAARAWREWIPVREDEADPLAIHRAFRFGDLAELVMLDTRVVGRARQTTADQRELREAADRSLLGATQEAWLFERLRASQQDGVAWRVIGQQVVMAQLRGEDGLELDLDKWDGYPAARARLFDVIEREGIRDLVVLTGDIHSSWAFELHRDPFGATPGNPLGVELVAPAVSSPPLARYGQMPGVRERHPHLRWVELHRRGYVEIAFGRDGAEATWHLTDDVDRPDRPVTAAKRLAIVRGQSRLVDSMDAGQPAHATPTPST